MIRTNPNKNRKISGVSLRKKIFRLTMGRMVSFKSPFRHILGGAFGGRELDEQLYGDFTE
jgi:hypothetical protein